MVVCWTDRKAGAGIFLESGVVQTDPESGRKEGDISERMLLANLVHRSMSIKQPDLWKVSVVFMRCFVVWYPMVASVCDKSLGV